MRHLSGNVTGTSNALHAIASMLILICGQTIQPLDNQEASFFHDQLLIPYIPDVQVRTHIAQCLEHREGSAEFFATLHTLIQTETACGKIYSQLASFLAKDEKNLNEAVICYRYAIARNSYDGTMLFAYAYACTRAGYIEEALSIFQTIASGYNSTSALYNCGYLLKMMGRVDEAIAYYERVLAIDPNNSNAHFARSRAYIQKGDFQSGWRLYEDDLKSMHRNAEPLRALLATDSLMGKTVVLRPEGGLGDTIQFIRYARELKKRGACIIATVQKPLLPLLSRCDFIDLLVPMGTKTPAYDADATLMTLPALFYSDIATIPRDIPYIFPDLELVHEWREKLASDSQYKIGICWQASIANDASRLLVGRRGIPLIKLMRIAACHNVSLYSLQQHDGVDELQQLDNPSLLKTFDATFDVDHGSFMDTAAIMHSLDLIITVDTAIAHLAGAMGRPVWLLLPYETDWRWITDRTDSPWYPTMRIFKQSKPLDWDSAMDQVVAALHGLTSL